MPTVIKKPPLRAASDDAVELIKSFEGIPDGNPSTVNIDAYLDPVGIWTIGWGHAIHYKGEWLRGAANRTIARAMYPGGITKAQAEQLLRADLLDTSAAVSLRLKVTVTDAQFGALLSFAFNLGAGALGQSTLLRKLNAGDFSGAADQFLVWNKARVNGVLTELPGLTRRRRAERAMFLAQDWRAAAVSRGAGKITRSAVAKAPAARKLGTKRGNKRGTKRGTKPEARPEGGPAIKPRGRTTTPTALPLSTPTKRPALRTKR